MTIKNHELEGWELIGHIGVDSGQMMLTDPCYADRFGGDFIPGDDDSPTGVYDYNGACTATLADAKAGILGNGTGAVCSTGFGDGSYGVYVRKSDEGAWGTRVSGMMIVFIGEDEDEDEDEDDLCVECCANPKGMGDLCDDCEEEHCCDCGNEKNPVDAACEECVAAEEDEES